MDMDKYFIKLQDKIFCVLQLFSFRGKYDSDMFWQVVLYTLLIVLIPTKFMNTYAFLVGGLFCFYIILAAYQKRLRYMGRKGTWHIIILSAYAIWCFLSILLPENKFIQDDKGGHLLYLPLVLPNWKEQKRRRMIKISLIRFCAIRFYILLVLSA